MKKIPVWEQRASCTRCNLEMTPSALGQHVQSCFDLTVENLVKYGRVIVPDDPDACWIWRGRRDTVTDRSRSYAHTPYGRANRAMFQAANDTDPGELDVCHTCDDPMCVSPRHLWLGTTSQNIKDAYDKGRRVGINVNPPRGDDHWLRQQPERANDVMKKVRSSIDAESYRKMGEANRGRVHTPQARENMRQGAIEREARKKKARGE